MKQLQALYRLQTLETSLDEAKARLLVIEETLKNNDALNSARSDLEARTREHQAAHGTLNNLELELTGLIDRLYQNEQTLYSGRITNPKELQERQQEIEALKRRQTKLEEDISSAKQVHQDSVASQDAAQEVLTLVEQRVAEENDDLIKEAETLRGRMGGWLKERKTMLEQVSPDNHKIYKQLKAQKNGLAVVRLRNRVCLGCQIEQNQKIVDQVRQGDDLVYCLACKRILVEG
jgi:uncharacterized protein